MNSTASLTDAGNKWLPEINIIRGFAILSVIFIHVTANFVGISILTPIALVNMIADAFLHFAVPLFILISGLVLSLAIWKRGSCVKFYMNRFQSIIPQYLIFTIIYMLLSVLILGQSISLTNFFGELFAGTAWPHLWFIPLIVELYLLYPLLIRIYDYFYRRNRLKIFLVSALIIQIGFSVARTLTNTIIIEDETSQFVLNSFPGYLFYFVLGIYTGRNYEAIKEKIAARNISLFVIIAIASGSIATLYFSARYFNFPSFLSLSASYMGWSLAIPPLTVATFVLFFRLASLPTFQSSKTGCLIDEMGTYAFGIYLVHPLFISVYQSALTRLLGISIDAAAFYVLLAVLTVGSSFIFVKVASMLPYGDWIVGAKTRKTRPQIKG